MIAKNHAVLFGRHLKMEWPTGIQPGQTLHRLVLGHFGGIRVNFDDFFAGGVAQHDQPLPVIQPLGQAITHARRLAVLNGCALPV